MPTCKYILNKGIKKNKECGRRINVPGEKYCYEHKKRLRDKQKKKLLYDTIDNEIKKTESDTDLDSLSESKIKSLLKPESKKNKNKIVVVDDEPIKSEDPEPIKPEDPEFAVEKTKESDESDESFKSEESEEHEEAGNFKSEEDEKQDILSTLGKYLSEGNTEKAKKFIIDLCNQKIISESVCKSILDKI